METYILVALLISVIWGLSPIMYKHLLDKYHPTSVLAFVSIAYFICVFIMGCSNHKSILDDYNKIDFNDICWVILVSVSGLFIANILQVTVLKDNDPSVVSPIIYSCPLITLLAAYLLFNTTMNLPCLFGSFLIVTGVLCISACSDNYNAKIDLNKLFKLA
jgi:drug/metabolite transporter (DMT)-like permease